MRVSPKVVLLVVCALATIVFAAAKPKKEAKMTVRDANATTVDANTAPQPEKKSVTMEVKTPAPEPTVSEPAAEESGVAVTVNGVDITDAEIDAKIKPTMDRASGQMAPAVAEQYKKHVKTQAVEMSIVERLLDEQVKKANITASDSDVNDRINEILAKQGMSMDAFKSMLQARGQDWEAVREDIAKALAYEKLVDSQSGSTDVNDADALAFYEANTEDYNTPEQVQASHILIKVEPSATPEERAAAKEKTEKLLKQIREGGDFAAIAGENSDCPSKVKGGDLGFFGRGAMVEPFENAAFGMQVGQISDVVETQFGYHIIKVADRKPAGQTPFEEAKPEIVKILQNQKKGRLFRQYIEKLKSEATIVYPPGKDPRAGMASPRPAPAAE